MVYREEHLSEPITVGRPRLAWTMTGAVAVDIGQAFMILVKTMAMVDMTLLNRDSGAHQIGWYGPRIMIQQSHINYGHWYGPRIMRVWYPSLACTYAAHLDM